MLLSNLMISFTRLRMRFKNLSSRDKCSSKKRA
jgi:hypothetical protein